MFRDMTPERTANAIMQDNMFNGTYLIVEGKKDFNLYSKFVDVDNSVEIKQVGGKEKVKSVIKILDERDFSNKIGIVDADFSKLTNEEPLMDNIYTTDCHDSEVMMYNSKALENMLNIYISKKKLLGFLDGREIREILMNIAQEIGILRLANHLYSLGLAFKPKQIDGKPLKYDKFINEKNFEFKGREQLIDTVINYSLNRNGKISSKEQVKDLFDELSNSGYDLLHLVNGHDLSNILYILLKKSLKSTNKSLHDYNSLEDAIILAYESTFFFETELFKNLFIWSIDNNNFFFKNDIKELYQRINAVNV
ncbi:DUF4435 domain-containing protein [Bacillus safensis]|uniref:DUF4435 domain-containing protein n=1 Tax=Bacillus safensis TaxID=561879 RepID=UPI002E2C8AEE|nr:DUF4435 domain-containing protein [Bacillus safensis]MED5221960.1 DUF4435 domain-containing protein [Bacillus safensis]